MDAAFDGGHGHLQTTPRTAIIGTGCITLIWNDRRPRPLCTNYLPRALIVTQSSFKIAISCTKVRLASVSLLPLQVESGRTSRKNKVRMCCGVLFSNVCCGSRSKNAQQRTKSTTTNTSAAYTQERNGNFLLQEVPTHKKSSFLRVRRT